jgi:membrane protein
VRRRLGKADWIAIGKRAGKETLDHNMPMLASALAYSSFLAIPSVLLLAVGAFTLVAGPDTIQSLAQHLGTVLAVWSTTGAMTAFMTALNLAYGRKDRRSFVKRRLVALAMAACIGVAVFLVAVFLIFGPQIEEYVGRALGVESALGYVWWVAQWPIVVVGLLAAFAALLYLGPDLDRPRWRFFTAGSAVAAAIWILGSGAFAFYTAHFSSYNKTWGSLSAVIAMLTWLWLSSLALLFGAEVNAEVERTAVGGS